MNQNRYRGGNLFQCTGCLTQFSSNRALSTHQAKSLYCNDYIASLNHHSSPYLGNNPNTQSTQINIETQHNEIIENDENCKPSPIELNTENEEIDSINSGYSVPNSSFHFSNSIVHEVKLLRILTDIGAPLYAYKTLMEWAHEAHMSDFKFDSIHKTYQQTIKYLEENLNFHIARPKYVPVTLIPDQLTMNVVVFDVKKMIASLFDDPKLNQYNNLVISSKN